MLYGMTLLLCLALVVLDPSWVAILYLGLSLVLLWSVARTSIAIRGLHRVLDIRVTSQIGTWLATAAVIALPWALGGVQPSRSHLTWAILLIGVLAFTSSASLALSTFDISRLEATTGHKQRETRPTLHTETGAQPDVEVIADEDDAPRGASTPDDRRRTAVGERR